MLRYADELIRYLSTFLKDLQEAEDLMLDCFTVIFVDQPRIGEGCFRAYLFKIARNKACSFWTRKLKRNEFSLSEELSEDFHGQSDLIAAQEASLEEKILAKERNAILQKCLNRVAPQYREALWLIYGMQFNYEQAAQIMGCTKKRIANLLVKGKKALKEELLQEGITYPDAY